MTNFGGFDGTSPIASLIARLVTSPRVQYMGKQFQNQLPQMSGPLRTSNPNGSRSIGASPQATAMGQGLGQSLNSIASLLGGGQQQQTDPLMDLYSQLISQLQQPVAQPNPIDTAGIMDQVKAAINPIYDARVNAAKSQESRASKDVQGMYGALSQDYEKLAPQQVAQAAAAKQQVEQLYGQLRSNITGDYSRISKEQGDLFKSLGIESALPDVLADQNPQVQEATTAAAQNEAQQEQRYTDMGQIDSTYYREGAPQALAKGNEVSTDLLAQLQDYLGQVEGERSSGIQSGYMDQLGQAQTRYAQQQQQAASQTSNNQDKLWQMLQSTMQNKQQTALNPDSFMSQLPQGVQQSVAGAFTQLQRSPEAVYGKVQDPRNPVPGTYVATTPEWYLSQADKMFQEGQIDSTTHQALLMYIQLNFKGQ